MQIVLRARHRHSRPKANIRGHIWYLRQVRRAYRPKTPEGAANSSYVHFLFGLIFKYEATTEQGHRSQGPNDTARPRRRGDRMMGWMAPLRHRRAKLVFRRITRNGSHP